MMHEMLYQSYQSNLPIIWHSFIYNHNWIQIILSLGLTITIIVELETKVRKVFTFNNHGEGPYPTRASSWLNTHFHIQESILKRHYAKSITPLPQGK